MVESYNNVNYSRKDLSPNFDLRAAEGREGFLGWVAGREKKPSLGFSHLLLPPEDVPLHSPNPVFTTAFVPHLAACR